MAGGHDEIIPLDAITAGHCFCNSFIIHSEIIQGGFKKHLPSETFIIFAEVLHNDLQVIASHMGIRHIHDLRWSAGFNIT